MMVISPGYRSRETRLGDPNVPHILSSELRLQPARERKSG